MKHYFTSQKVKFELQTIDLNGSTNQSRQKLYFTELLPEKHELNKDLANL